MSTQVYDPRRFRRRGQGRRIQKRIVKQKERQGRGGGALTGFRFRARFKPPAVYKDEDTGRVISPEAARIRLYPGTYRGFDGSDLTFYEYVEHYAARVKRGHICSKVYRENEEGELDSDGKCISCHERKNGAQDINWRRMSAFMLIWLDWFYLVPAVDKDGKRIKYKRDGKFHKAGDQVYDRVHQSEVDKREARREGYEKVFGKLMHWSMGSNHLSVLSSKMADLERECHCGGEISIALYECPKCGDEVFDLTDEDFDLSLEELDKCTSEPFECPSCKKKVDLLPVEVCDNCEDPDPLSIWEVDLWVRREGANTSSTLIVSKHKHCDLDDRVLDLLPKKDLLHRIFAPDKIDIQARILKTENPWSDDDDTGSTRRKVQDYEEGDEEGSVDDDIPF